jgi:hypothetical protein
MGKNYWEFITSDEKEPPFPKKSHTTINSSE